MSEEKKLYITKSLAIFIFIYYLGLFFLGLSGVAYTLLLAKITNISIFQQAFIGSVSIALSSASAAYIRKLYKLCFNFSTVQNGDNQLFYKRLGTTAYFIARPIFSVLFASFVVVGIRSGIMLSTSAEFEIDEGFIYLTMVSSFYVGFLSGDFIAKIEAKGQKKLDSLTG